MLGHAPGHNANNDGFSNNNVLDLSAGTPFFQIGNHLRYIYAGFTLVEQTNAALANNGFLVMETAPANNAWWLRQLTVSVTLAGKFALHNGTSVLYSFTLPALVTTQIPLPPEGLFTTVLAAPLQIQNLSGAAANIYATAYYRNVVYF